LAERTVKTIIPKLGENRNNTYTNGLRTGFSKNIKLISTDHMWFDTLLKHTQLYHCRHSLCVVNATLGSYVVHIGMEYFNGLFDKILAKSKNPLLIWFEFRYHKPGIFHYTWLARKRKPTNKHNSFTAGLIDYIN
jgi:hypothetical protein